MEVLKVRYNKSNGQKIITVPKGCDIQPNEYVVVRKFEESKQ